MDLRDCRTADVVVLAPVGTLSYRVPAALVSEMAVGMCVEVPLGRRTVQGYVAQLHDTQPSGTAIERLKDIRAIDNERPMVPASLMALVAFASRYYRAWPGDMLRAALPHRARPAKLAFRLTEQGHAEATTQGTAARPPKVLSHPQPITKQDVLVWAQGRPKGFTATALCRALGGERAASLRLLRRLVAQQLVEPQSQRASRPKQEAWLSLRAGADIEALSARQGRARRLFALLPPNGSPISLKALREIDPAAAQAATALRKRGLCDWHETDVRQSPWAQTQAQEGSSRPPQPSPDQARALAALHADIESHVFSVSLLFGITGSGKTEVYLQAIERALQQGRTALVLVPEIALTPQLGARFRARFGDWVATFHSGLSLAERRDEWERVASGQARIALGARSAVFLPLERLGIVVVDEEHESSYKQEESPHYHARDLAIWRGKEASAVVVLGSATPSLESWHNVTLGRSRCLPLSTRAQGQALASVSILDLKTTPPQTDTLLAPPLVTAIEQTLARGEQVILFLNRRGFAPYIVCRDCAHAFRCGQCEVSLTLHRRRQALVCHYCGYTEAPPQKCPMCLGQRVDAYGPGIERLEAEVKDRFAAFESIRLDRDTVRSRVELSAALDRFRSGKAQLLIGTQMVAKGHDFPNVTLVGVVSADGSLNLPDFRAAERTFQLLTQVAGRAGRGERKGHVIVQAIDTQHEAVLAASEQNFERFAAYELTQRQAAGYPPFAFLALVRIEGHELGDVEAHASRVAEALAGRIEAVHVLGPAPAPLAKLRGQWRFVVLLKAKERRALQQAIATVESLARAPGGVRRLVDVDPMHML